MKFDGGRCIRVVCSREIGQTCSPKKLVMASSWARSLLSRCCSAFGPNWNAARRPVSELVPVLLLMLVTQHQMPPGIHHDRQGV